jgi:hypothetical protein
LTSGWAKYIVLWFEDFYGNQLLLKAREEYLVKIEFFKVGILEI